MMRMRRVLEVALPLAAITLFLAPGLSAKQSRPKQVKHSTIKHKLPRTPSHKARTTVHNKQAKSSFSSHEASVSPHRKTRHARRKKTRLPAGPSSDRIEEIQRALARSGYYQGDPTGKWDADTVDAMKRFQQAEGMTPSGKIDASSLQRLGLGSDVAGVSAPRPVAPAGTTGAEAKENKGSGDGR